MAEKNIEDLLKKCNALEKKITALEKMVTRHENKLKEVAPDPKPTVKSKPKELPKQTTFTAKYINEEGKEETGTFELIAKRIFRDPRNQRKVHPFDAMKDKGLLQALVDKKSSLVKMKK